LPSSFAVKMSRFRWCDGGPNVSILILPDFSSLSMAARRSGLVSPLASWSLLKTAAAKVTPWFGETSRPSRLNLARSVRKTSSAFCSAANLSSPTGPLVRAAVRSVRGRVRGLRPTATREGSSLARRRRKAWLRLRRDIVQHDPFPLRDRDAFPIGGVYDAGE